jgi:hypothetical protein
VRLHLRDADRIAFLQVIGGAVDVDPDLALRHVVELFRGVDLRRRMVSGLGDGHREGHSGSMSQAHVDARAVGRVGI